MKIFLELTLGHRAVVREKPTADGYTHDWEVFVRQDQGQIQAFVDKVVFNLHESFTKPRRVVKEPPFFIKESGYAGFNIKIEVFFKNKEEPKKAEFNYDLYLQSGGAPINHNRKEKLIFNFPSEEFSKKLFKGGGVVHEEKKSSRGADAAVASSSAYITSSAGGKPAKHSSTNTSRSSPKDSFETLFGTPIKRSRPSLTTTSVLPSASPKSGKSGKGDKTEKIFGDISDVKVEKLSSKSKSGKSPKLDSPSGSSSSPSSSKSGSGPEKKSNKAEEKLKKMLPPENASVPKKVKKSSEIFESSSKKSKEKTKKKSSKTHKIKAEPDSNPATPDAVDVKQEPELENKAERIQPLSPISANSRSRSSSGSSARSPNQALSDDERRSDSEREEKSNKRIAAATSSSKRRSKRSDSESGSEDSLIPSPAQPSPSSSCSSGGAAASPKRRKTSTSSSSLTPDHNSFQVEKPNSSSPVKVKKERHQKKEKKSRKSRKKSKKHKAEKEKILADALQSDSASSGDEQEEYTSPTAANGISSNSNGLSPNPALNHGNSNSPSGIITMTAEMKTLHELHARLVSLSDPKKLQELVDIVESCGHDSWTMETGYTFDFDLCKLSPITIKKIHEIFD